MGSIMGPGVFALSGIQRQPLLKPETSKEGQNSITPKNGMDPSVCIILASMGGHGSLAHLNPPLFCGILGPKIRETLHIDCKIRISRLLETHPLLESM